MGKEPTHLLVVLLVLLLLLDAVGFVDEDSEASEWLLISDRCSHAVSQRHDLFFFFFFFIFPPETAFTSLKQLLQHIARVFVIPGSQRVTIMKSLDYLKLSGVQHLVVLFFSYLCLSKQRISPP
jgi:hypothetical protein